jgi:hypothetical protein
LVAYHSGSRFEAGLGGLAVELAEFADADSALTRLLTYCDQTTGPRASRSSCVPEHHRPTDQPVQLAPARVPPAPGEGRFAPDTLHDLRHSAATLLLGIGVHPKIVSELLGHTQVGITLDVYSHVTATMQHQTVSALDDLLAVKLAVNQDGQTQNRS